MGFIKTEFTIKDLENLSGVKKHTIRVWEKRYNLLTPERTKTNIRYYSTSSLRHLLNIVLLYDNGYKISKIAKLDHSEILTACKNLVAEKAEKNQFINEMKIAMLHFDQQLFEKTYEKLNDVLPFPDVFQHYFLPFLNEIGLLWQTNSINPAHEHFISNLIKQKVLLHTEKLMLDKTRHKGHKVVLFLPDNEIHDLGITYLNFEILNKGFQTVFLGQSVPISCLDAFSPDDGTLIFISYFTVKPDASEILEYFEEFNTTVLSSSNAELWILGPQVQQISKSKLPTGIKIFASIPDVLKNIGTINHN
ncbi:MAG: DNA-binding transcriptional MerR regulator [Saprospiraceae bacterium]|jgi:DNA-binding transcriptional MerR regulator